jgi:hypothetical protein
MSLIWFALALVVLRVGGVISTLTAARLFVFLLGLILVMLVGWSWADQRCVDQLQGPPVPAANGPVVWTT